MLTSNRSQVEAGSRDGGVTTGATSSGATASSGATSSGAQLAWAASAFSTAAWWLELGPLSQEAADTSAAVSVSWHWM